MQEDSGFGTIPRVLRRRRRRAASLSHETALSRTSWVEQHARDVFAYEMLVQRQVEQDSMQWEAPSLALTAQAFLLTIALSPDTALLPRVLVNVLGIAISFLTIQLMAKHYYLSSLDQAQMQYLEMKLGLPKIATREWSRRAVRAVEQPRRKLLVRLRSSTVWRVGLILIAIINAAVLLIALLWPDLLSGPAPSTQP